MTHQKKLIIFGATVAAIGVAVIAPLVFFWAQQRIAAANPATITVPSVAPLPEAKPTLITGKPAQLSIPSLDINLAVADGAYNDKTHQWSLSSDKAHYALPTVQPNNESGNTLIYGHYRLGVFATLRLIQPGATVTVDTDNGYRFTYTFRSSQKVSPNDTSIFAYQGKPQLTIQTCTGVYMQDRNLFYFDFTGAESLSK